MDGYEAYAAEPQFENVLFIALSGSGKKPTGNAVKRPASMAHMVRPVKMDRIEEILANLTRQSRQ